MTTLMLMVIIMGVTSMANVRISNVLAQIDPSTQLVQVDHVSFEYNKFPKDNEIDSLALFYNATIDNHSHTLQLISMSSFANMQRGLVVYSKPIKYQGLSLKTKKCAIASFSTSFAFSINSSSINQGGNQVFFFLMENPINSSFDGSPFYHDNITLKNRKEPFHSFVVEYDSSKDKVLDITSNHKYMMEQNHHNLSSLVRINPYVFGALSSVEKIIYSWIDYHDYSKELEVRVSNDKKKPHQPMVKIAIDLKPLYGDLVYVGLSSQSQFGSAKISIHNWSFDTKLKAGSIASNQSIAPGIAPSSVLAPAPTPETSVVLQYLYFNERTTYLAKILGTIIGILLLIMLLCSILVGFSQFGFACIANPEDLIELEFSTLGEFGKFEEEVEVKVPISTNRVKDLPKVGPMQRILEKIKEATLMKSNFQELHKVVGISKRQSVWRRASESRGSAEDKIVKVPTKIQTNFKNKDKTASSMAGLVFGLIRPSRSIEEPSKTSNDLSIAHEKEQIANLIQKATHVEEEVEATRYQYKELSEATNDFGSRNKLGGTKSHETYRGVLFKDSTPIIVKVINIEVRIKSKAIRAEMSILSRLQHRHLVKLLGWCKNQGKLYVVYELFLGKSLHRVAFVNDGVLISYPWAKRFKTIKDIASALLYLHEGWECPLIHKNVKLNNVMIESELNNCKLGDYGLSFLIDTDQAEPPQEYAQFFEQPTYGYFAPEYTERKIGTKYIDVYSFGILCLEIVCRRPLEDRTKGPEAQMLVEWLLYLEDEDNLVEAIEDNDLQESELRQSIMVLSLGLMCVDVLPEQRPSMKQIVKCLSGETSFPPTLVSKTDDTLASTPIDVSTLGEVVSSNGYDPIIELKENILFDNQNQWIDADFLVGDEAQFYEKLSLTNNSWTDIEDDFILTSDDARSSLPLCQENNTWVDIVDIEAPIPKYPNSLIILSQVKNSWMDVQNIDLSPITIPFPIESNTTWVDIDTIPTNEYLQPKALPIASQEEVKHLLSSMQIEWMDTLEVLIPSTTHTANPLVDLMLEIPEKNNSCCSTPIPTKVPHEYQFKKKSGGAIPLLRGKALPLPVWPLPIPKVQPTTEPLEQIYDPCRPAQASFPTHSKTKPQAKDTHIELASPSFPTKSSTSIDISYKKNVSSPHFPSHLSSLSTPLPSYLPPYYGHQKPLSPSFGLQNCEHAPHHRSQSPFHASPSMVESSDLNAHSKRFKPEDFLKKKKNPMYLQRPKNKFDLASQLNLFPPIWPLPTPKVNLGDRESALVVDTKMRNLVNKRKHEQ